MSEKTEGISILPVPQHLAYAVWDEVKDYLDGAIQTANGKCTVDDVRAGVDSGMYLLWVAMDGQDIIAAFTTRIIEYPRRRAMAMDWVGGKRMREWIGALNKTMVDHAKANGCSHIEGYGRPAWLRWTRRYGWKEEYVAFKLEV